LVNKKLNYGWGRSIGSRKGTFHYFEKRSADKSVCHIIIKLDNSHFTFFPEKKIRHESLKCKKCLQVVNLKEELKKLLKS